MRTLKRQVALLKKQCDDHLTAKRACSTGEQVTVDYFALTKLLEYFKETQESASRVARARDLLENVMFSVRVEPADDRS